MKTFLIAAAASAAAFAALPAAAESITPAVYGTLGYSFVDGGSDVNFGALNGRVGARLHKYFGVEGEAAIGVDGDSTRVGAVTVKSKLKHSLAAYAVGVLPVNDKLDVFVRGGYGTTRVRVSAAGTSLSDSEESWNYGAGAQVMFDPQNGVRGDYTRYDFNHGAGDADVWTVSYVRKF